MTATVFHFDFDRSQLPPIMRGGGTAPPRLPSQSRPRWGLFSPILNLFGSAPQRLGWEPEQSRPARSSLRVTAPRDGGAPFREVRRIREAPPPQTLADYAPKPVEIVDLEGMRAKLRALPRQRVEAIAAAIGSRPVDLLCFAMGAAA